MLVHENAPAQVRPDLPAVFLLHGLGSSHAGTYMTNIAQGLVDRGVRVFRADLPGAGPSCRTTYLPPHGACHDLVRRCLAHLTQALGIERWRLAGVSLGGNLVLRMLTEPTCQLSDDDLFGRIEFALAVAPPIDLGECCRNMEQGLNRIYGAYFMRALKKQAEKRAERWPQWRDVLQRADYSTIRRLDETVTSQLAGFAGAEAYYAAGSSIDRLDTMRVPTILLVDEHDPIVPIRLFDRMPRSDFITTIRTKHGGHVGYLQRATHSEQTPSSRWGRWADPWVADLLADPSQPPQRCRV